ncbi:MAG TPA: hypothetical protein VF062_00480 [Candidatus Limnocylindrales bacterium]
MANPRIDRGFAAVKQEPDGTRTVAVGRTLIHGRLAGVFAEHHSVAAVRIGPGVALTAAGPFTHTDHEVEVFRIEGQPLTIRPVS